MSRSYYSHQAVYDKLLSLSVGGKVTAPPGENFVAFLMVKFGWKNRVSVYASIKKLEALQLASKQNDASGRLVSLKLLKFPEPPQTLPKIKEVNEPKVSMVRRFAILIDYENLEKNVSHDKLVDFSWLITPLLEEGVIARAMVFFPEHMVGRVPIRTLSNLERFLCVVCPRGHRGVTKTVDTVDTRMIDEGKFLADHSDVTDIVVISGDGDFHELIKFAYYHQKRMRLIAPETAVAGRLTAEMAIDKQVLLA